MAVATERFLNIIKSHLDRQPLNENLGIFQYKIITSDNNESIICNIDLNRGIVSQINDDNDSNLKPDCIFLINEEDLINLIDGSLDFGQGYLTGRIKVTGNMPSAFKFKQFYSDVRSSMLKLENVNNNEPLTTVPVDGLKSDIVFELMRERLAIEPELFRTISFLIQILLTRDGSGEPIAKWTVDTKTGKNPRIWRQSGTENNDSMIKKPDATITVSDDDFVGILFGRLNPQRIFIGGKMKIKGNIMLLQRLNQFWNKVQSQSADAHYPLIKDVLMNTKLLPGLQSEMLFFKLLPRLMIASSPVINGSIIKFIVRNNGQPMTAWELHYNQESKLERLHHRLLEGEDRDKFPVKIIIDDDQFANLVLTGQTSMAIIDGDPEKKNAFCQMLRNDTPLKAKL